jgi:hypothetical protein
MFLKYQTMLVQCLFRPECLDALCNLSIYISTVLLNNFITTAMIPDIFLTFVVQVLLPQMNVGDIN